MYYLEGNRDDDALSGTRDATPNFFDDLGVWEALGIAGATMGVYHGYKRNHDSIGWALGWGLFGSLLPIVAIPLMLAEGFAEPARP